MVCISIDNLFFEQSKLALALCCCHWNSKTHGREKRELKKGHICEERKYATLTFLGLQRLSRENPPLTTAGASRRRWAFPSLLNERITKSKTGYQWSRWTVKTAI